MFMTDVSFVALGVPKYTPGHKPNHCPQSNQQQVGSLDVQLCSSRLLLPDILCTITTCSVITVWRIFLNPSVYLYYITYLLKCLNFIITSPISFSQLVHITLDRFVVINRK